MNAKITRQYTCLPNGHPPELTLYPGDVVEGQIAEWAVADGYAEEIKLQAKPATKAKKGQI